MGFSICIRHINCRVGLPHKISMYWNKLLMYQNMNTYIHFWSFKRNHFPLSIFSFFFFFFSFYTSGDGTVFQSVNENYVTTVSQKKFLIRLSAIGLCDSFLLGNNTISYQGKKKQRVWKKLILGLFLRNMTWETDFMLQLEAEKNTTLYLHSVSQLCRECLNQ